MQPACAAAAAAAIGGARDSATTHDSATTPCECGAHHPAIAIAAIAHPPIAHPPIAHPPRGRALPREPPPVWPTDALSALL